MTQTACRSQTTAATKGRRNRLGQQEQMQACQRKQRTGAKKDGLLSRGSQPITDLRVDRLYAH
ncbi:hypothetical protein PAMP_019559 [Pampus punctatissimus]